MLKRLSSYSYFRTGHTFLFKYKITTIVPKEVLEPILAKIHAYKIISNVAWKE